MSIIFLMSLLFTSRVLAANDTDCKINIPGYSNHGNCDLLCRDANWEDVLYFYVANYVIHAATVNTKPGQSFLDTASIALLALFFPGVGVYVAVEAIFSRAVLAPTQLQQAARAGALYAIVEVPHRLSHALVTGAQAEVEQGAAHASGDEAIELGHRNSASRIDPDPGLQAKDAPSMPSLFAWMESLSFGVLMLGPDTRSVMAPSLHGRCVLPKGYELRLVPWNAQFEDDIPDDPAVGWWRLFAWFCKPIQSMFKPPPARTAIASSYSAVKVVIAIIQLFSSVKTLYSTRGDQISRFGYAAFGLTVAPYTWMTLINLIGALMRPQYSARFLVGSSGSRKLVEKLKTAQEQCKFPLTGLVGELSRDSDKVLSDATEVRSEDRLSSTGFSYFLPSNTAEVETMNRTIKMSGGPEGNFAFCISLVPLILVGALSKFSAGHSELYQRVWTMMWLVLGICFGSVTTMESAGVGRHFMRLTLLIIYGVTSVGGFVVVGQMIMQYGACQIIR